MKMANEKRLIYAEDLFKPVDFTVFQVSKGGQSSGKTMAIYEQLFRKRVEMAPTVDAVEVVRCKDCKNNGACSIQDAMNWTPRTEIGDYFCSYGERRTK